MEQLDSESLEQTIAVNGSSINKIYLVSGKGAQLHG